MKQRSYDYDYPVAGFPSQALVMSPDDVASVWAISRSVSRVKTMNWNCYCVAVRKSPVGTTNGDVL